MLELEGRYKARGLRVIGVCDVDDAADAEERAEVAKAATEEKMVYPTFLDVGGAWREQAKVAKAPAFVVLDKEGRLVTAYRGKLTAGTDDHAKLVAAIEKSL